MHATLRALLAEALGSLFLLATVVGSGIMAERLAGDSIALALLCNTIPTGAILAVLITIFGPISGAHFNPVVSLAFRLKKQINSKLMICYIIVQIIAAVLGVLIAHAMFEQTLLQTSTTLRSGYGQWFAEAVATFGLILTIFGSIAYAPKATAGLVGLYITAAYWFTASTSFANPAVTIARGFSNTFAGIAPINVPAFIAAQLLGALLALLLCNVLFHRTE